MVIYHYAAGKSSSRSAKPFGGMRSQSVAINVGKTAGSTTSSSTMAEATGGATTTAATATATATATAAAGDSESSDMVERVRAGGETAPESGETIGAGSPATGTVVEEGGEGGSTGACSDSRGTSGRRRGSLRRFTGQGLFCFCYKMTFFVIRLVGS